MDPSLNARLPASHEQARRNGCRWLAYSKEMHDLIGRPEPASVAAMQMPCAAPARSGRFGFGGVEASSAPAPVATMPSAESSEAQASGNGYLAQVLKSLLAAPAGANGAGSATGAAAAAPPPRSIMQAAPQASARFDAQRFYALLRGMR